MKLVVASALLALSSCMSVPGSQAAPAAQPAQAGSPPTAVTERQFLVYLGQRSLDKDLWSPVEDQGTLGFEYTQESAADVVGWEIGLMGSQDDSTLGGFDVTGKTFEIYAGVRKTFGTGQFRPYLGAGLSFIKGDGEVGGVSDDDSSAAGYAHGGVQFLASPTFSIGLDIRGLFGSDLTLAGVDADVDYTQAALTFGWRF